MPADQITECIGREPGVLCIQQQLFAGPDVFERAVKVRQLELQLVVVQQLEIAGSDQCLIGTDARREYLVEDEMPYPLRGEVGVDLGALLHQCQHSPARLDTAKRGIV